MLQQSSKIKKVLVFALGTALLWAVPGTGLSKDRPFSVITMDKDAPPISLSKVDGGEFSLGDTQAKVIIINFWATWCKVCKKEMPSLDALDKKYDDIAVVMVAGDSHKRVKKYLADKDYGFTVIIDQYGTAMKDYGVVAFPHTFIIKKGRVVGHIFGEADFTGEVATTYFDKLMVK